MMVENEWIARRIVLINSRTTQLKSGIQIHKNKNRKHVSAENDETDK